MLDHFGQKRRQFIYYFKSKASKRLAPIKNCLVLRYLLRVLESASSENEDYGINGDVCLILWFEFSKCDQLLSLNILIVI